MTGTPHGRLDRIEAAIEGINSTLEAIATDFLRPAFQQTVENRNSFVAVDQRLERVATVLADTTIKQDAIAAGVAANVSAIAANERRFENLLNELRADRTEHRQRCDEIQRKAEEDRKRADSDRAAQMQVIQSLLLELTRTNGNVNTMSSGVNALRDRVDTLEQAS